MSAALEKAGKAAASTIPSLVPVLIYTGVGYLIYLAVKEHLKDLKKGAGGVEEAELLSQSVLGGVAGGALTAAVLEPARDGIAATSGLLREEYPVKFTVNNPGDKRPALLRYEVDEYPPAPFSKTVSVWTESVELKPGKNLFEIRIPKTATNLQGYTTAVAKVLIDGKQYASTSYTIE